MKISEKINKVHKRIVAEMGVGNYQFVKDLQTDAIAALWGGIKSEEWRKYMVYFASNPEQLTRLTGNDHPYNATVYGVKALAYMTANGTCGPTTDTYTGRYLDEYVMEDLDRDLPIATGPIPGFIREQEAVVRFINNAHSSDNV